MSWIPKDARWYLAQMVEEITVDGERENVVHANWMLIRAESPEEAYEKALALGKGGETTYDNPEGRLVTIRFRGLRDLTMIYEDLEDGAELYYEEGIGVPEAEIARSVRPRDGLAVFRPITQRIRPNYASREIVEEVESLLAQKQIEPAKE